LRHIPILNSYLGSADHAGNAAREIDRVANSNVRVLTPIS
jgi:hypothetical protein